MAVRYNVRQFVMWLVLLQVAFGIRLAAAQWWDARLPEGQKFAFGDSDGYWELARTIARGEPYEYEGYRVFRTPGYPLLLAPLFRLADEPPVLWGRVEGALFGTIAVGLLVLLTWKLFDERTAWIAGLIATFYPGQIASSIFVLSEAPFMPLMVGHLYAWITAAKSPCLRGRIGYAILGGVLCGIAVLVRPSWLLFLPFATGLTLLLSRERIKHVQIALVMFLLFCITMSPWWVRNYQVTGRFVPTSLQVGISLADGWNPEADGASDLKRAKRAILEYFLRQRDTGLGVGVSALQLMENSVARGQRAEPGLNQFYVNTARHWASQHRGRAVQLAGIKFLRMWNFLPNASEFGSLKFRLLYALTYTPLLICCLLGFWKFRQRGFEVWLLFLPAVYFTLLHMIFVSSIRYQQPAMLAWMVLAAALLGSTKFQGPNSKERTKDEIPSTKA